MEWMRFGLMDSSKKADFRSLLKSGFNQLKELRESMSQQSIGTGYQAEKNCSPTKKLL